MESTDDPLVRAMLLATGLTTTRAPLPDQLPATPAATSNSNSSNSNSKDTAGPNPSSVQKREQRDQINQKIAELEKLIRKDFDETMSKKEILEVAMENVVEIRRKPCKDRLQGLNDAIDQIERLTVSRLNSSRLTGTSHTKNLQEMLNLFREVVNPGSSTTNLSTSPLDAPVPSTSASYTTERGKINNRAKLRREKLIDRFDVLKQFVVENKILSNYMVRITKLQALEAVIDCIRNNPHMPQPDPVQRSIGFEQGKHLTRIVITDFFNSYDHLRTQIPAFHNLIDSQFGPLEPSIQTSDIHINHIAHQSFVALYPTFCLQSSLLNHAVAPSAPRPVPAPAQVPTSVLIPEKKSFFRPWE